LPLNGKSFNRITQEYQLNNNLFSADDFTLKLGKTPVRLYDIAEVAANIHTAQCSGRGTCGRCRVLITGGDASAVSEEEKKILSEDELSKGIRLACFCEMKGEISLRFPERTNMQILGVSSDSGKSGFPAEEKISGNYGIVFDIGTTSVVGLLVDLKNGNRLSSTSRLNPQCRFGPDVLSRISHASDNEGTERLNSMIIDCINDMIEENCEYAAIPDNEIKKITVTGNNVMLHLLSGVNPSSMGRFPYKPVFTAGFSLPAVFLGLEKTDKAEIYFTPSASAFIGADIIAGILATSLDSGEDNSLLLDMGTNGEIVLFSNGTLSACSVAMGPALEGMSIECGMRAETGAVDRIWMEDEKILFHTIGESAPAGLCGSGMIDAVRLLVEEKIITPAGRMISGMVTLTDEGKKFQLIHTDGNDAGIYISQNDIRNLQLAKGAVCSGIMLLLESAGIKISDVKKIYLAGALGYYGNAESLFQTGFLPGPWREKIFKAGNTALTGAELIMLSATMRQRAEEISRNIHHLDLVSHHRFHDLFVRFMSFSQSTWHK